VGTIRNPNPENRDQAIIYGCLILAVLFLGLLLVGGTVLALM